MAVPKRKTSKSRRDMRSACKFLRPKAFSQCSQCTEPLAPHTICKTCGYYRGRKVLRTKLDRTLARHESRPMRESAGVEGGKPEAPAAE